MVQKNDFTRINDYVWELPPTYDGRMRVPARIYGNEDVFEMAFRDQSVEQLMNVAMLPGIVKYAMAMPDMHQGYGFPIGGVAAFRYNEGIISPGGVGYDINCGVRMLASSLDYASIAPYLKDLTATIFRNCPSGVGGKGAVQLSAQDLNAVLEQGAEWALAKGYASRDDLERTESYGQIAGARADAVDARAKERGLPQMGSLGAGNHFLEIDVVDEIYAADIAAAFGLVRDDIVVQIHCGSRGLGHEVCGQYIRVLQDAPRRYGIDIPDRELVAAPVDSREGRDYLAAMAAAANYAFANRQILAHFVRRSFEQVLAGKVRDWNLHQVYDVTHNVAKIEEHSVGGQRMKLVVHRKGATRAFPPRHPDLPAVYRETGQPVLVPGSMGTASYVLVGTETALKDTFGSTCHGAGRMMSRNAALKQMRGEQVRSALNQQGIVVRTDSLKGLAEEAPYAYKDVSLVVDSVVGAGIARLVARVRPVAVIKG
ncbi:MAG TPA: RtcB family protein [Anaerolineae bacterium]|nr:RtcB family protein [Anaerolineae bacterium]HQH39155.1 RtcB family protein [Anaerolineae bacterium]